MMMYTLQESTPRILTIGGLGCPCGGTHVADISEIGSIKVSISDKSPVHFFIHSWSTAARETPSALNDEEKECR